MQLKPRLAQNPINTLALFWLLLSIGDPCQVLDFANRTRSITNYHCITLSQRLTLIPRSTIIIVAFIFFLLCVCHLKIDVVYCYQLFMRHADQFHEL